MTLKEWLEQNQDKEIVFEDGKLIITEPEPNSRWKPRFTNDYWCIDANGDIYRESWEGLPEEEELYEIGNTFETEEEAKAAAERLKIRAELLDCGGKETHEIKGTAGWNLIYTGKVDLAFNGFSHAFGIYFDSEDEAKAAIKKVGEDRIKKYLFGIEG